MAGAAPPPVAGSPIVAVAKVGGNSAGDCELGTGEAAGKLAIESVEGNVGLAEGGEDWGRGVAALGGAAAASGGLGVEAEAGSGAESVGLDNDAVGFAEGGGAWGGIAAHGGAASASGGLGLGACEAGSGGDRPAPADAATGGKEPSEGAAPASTLVGLAEEGAGWLALALWVNGAEAGAELETTTMLGGTGVRILRAWALAAAAAGAGWRPQGTRRGSLRFEAVVAKRDLRLGHSAGRWPSTAQMKQKGGRGAERSHRFPETWNDAFRRLPFRIIAALRTNSWSRWQKRTDTSVWAGSCWLWEGSAPK